MMMNQLIDFKDTVIKKFGPVLGYGILIIGGLAVLSVLGVLLKSVIKILISLAVAAVLVFVVYQVYVRLSSKKKV